MVAVEFFLDIMTRIFVEIIFKGIIVGTLNLFVKGFNFIKGNILGLIITKKQKNKKNENDNNLLYKEIELTVNLNSRLKKGQHGAVLEIIDEENVFAEFYDPNNQQIEFDNELVFQVQMNQFKLKK